MAFLLREGWGRRGADWPGTGVREGCVSVASRLYVSKIGVFKRGKSVVLAAILSRGCLVWPFDEDPGA